MFRSYTFRLSLHFLLSWMKVVLLEGCVNLLDCTGSPNTEGLLGIHMFLCSQHELDHSMRRILHEVEQEKTLRWFWKLRYKMASEDDDFTFCKVELADAHNSLPDLNSVTIKEVTARDDENSTLWKYNLPSNSMSKEETVGSLSFNIIDASVKQLASEDTGKSVTSSQEQKTAFRKPAPRAKVPFEKGYSQMDWIKLSRTHPDLAGLKGQSNRSLISLNKVKQQQTEGDMWTVLKGRVYNIDPYMKFHPGGVDMLMKAVGKDCTSLFNEYHPWVNADALLEKCLVGTLDSQ